MYGLLTYAVILMAAVLLSGLARRSVLSTAVMFLLGGFAAGWLGLISFRAESETASRLVQLALYSVLFTDGMKVSLGDLKSAWHLPGRALLLGLPLTLGLTALLARYVVGLAWDESLLLGAVLSPTDPVFAAAIVGREEVPQRLRRLLNVESGLNDGLALPVVVILLEVTGQTEVRALPLLIEVIAGIAVGVVVPWISIKLEQSRFFMADAVYKTINGFAIAALTLAVSEWVHVNELLAGFAAGVTVATVGPLVRQANEQFGEVVTELLKLAALLVFGAMLSTRFMAEVGVRGYVFAFLSLALVRPVAMGLSLIGSPLSRREAVVAGWFGPKGFSSVFYGILILRSGLQHGEHLFNLAGLVIAASIILHSSTDVLIVHWFKRRD